MNRYRRIFLVACVLACSFGVSAQDTIRFTCQVTAGNSWAFIVRATLDEPFTISWGDGVDSTYVGKGNDATIYYKYAVSGTRTVEMTMNSTVGHFTFLSIASRQLSNLDVRGAPELDRIMCNMNSLTSLDLSRNTKLTILECNDNKLTELDLSQNTKLVKLQCQYNPLGSLDLSNNSDLKELYCASSQLTSLKIASDAQVDAITCIDNRLLLSELYAASLTVVDINRYSPGQQKLAPQTLADSGTADFSMETKFGSPDTMTVFAVTKNNAAAIENVDYTITNGVITFNTSGKYTVTMTNSAIRAGASYPAKVIAEFTVGNDVGIFDYELQPSHCVIYPNPTNGQLSVVSSQFSEMGGEIVIYDIVGQIVFTSAMSPHSPEATIDISHLSAGLYFLKVDGKTVKVVKE